MYYILYIFAYNVFIIIIIIICTHMHAYMCIYTYIRVYIHSCTIPRLTVTMQLQPHAL